jgi:hypothetical protein
MRQTAISFTIPRIFRRENSNYQPTYRESDYRRPFYSRLTPLARFIVVLLAMGVIAGIVLAVNQASSAVNGTTLLSDQLPARVVMVTPTTLQLQVIIFATTEPTTTEQADATSAAQAEFEPTPGPTEPPHAPWSDKLTKAPDGTLIAPQPVVAKAMEDLGGYYSMQYNLSLDDYLIRRDDMLTTYFTGVALEDMRKIEEVRDLYAMNRSGKYTIEIRNFAPDGLSAKAGVITRGWVSDVYDVASKQLVAQGREKKDTLTIMSILFDPASNRWKFAAVDEVIELNQ